MAWSYSLSSLATSQKDQVRALVGDTDSTDPQLQDEEIEFFLTLRSNVYGAAAECCMTLATKGSSLANVLSQRAGDTEIKNSSASKGGVGAAYLLLAKQFELLATSPTGSAGFSPLPYVGGISRTDKEFYEGNDDLVKPSFAIGMFDGNMSRLTEN